MTFESMNIDDRSRARPLWTLLFVVLVGSFLYCSGNGASAAPESAATQSSSQLAASATQPVVDLMTQPMWVNHIEPILNKNCFKCHGAEKQKGGLDLRVAKSIFAGGSDGSVVIPGRPADSPLYQRILPGAKDHMPPDEDHQLNPEEVGIVQQWIATLPEPGRGGAGGASVNWVQATPSLMDLAAAAKWQPPQGMQGPDAIDHLIEQRWREQHISGAGVCDDRTFVRRIHLDLAGRIPTRTEADAFVNSADGGKRAALVDQLLASADFSRRMAEMLDVVLLERKGKAAEDERKAHGWFTFLEHSIAANRPWNEIVADLITARPKSADDKGAVWFLYERKNDYQQMAEAVAPVAFGVSIGCAQCHNHPLAHEIKQANYWGLVAAFNRTTNADTKTGAALSESAVGGFVNFTNLKKESQPALLVLLNDRTIAEKRPADGVKEQDSLDNYDVAPDMLGPPSSPENDKDKDKEKKKHGHQTAKTAAVPKFSRRQLVADAVTRDNPLLARAFVNRMWAMLIGRGFVTPVDQMDSRHPPSHPELLSWLARDFETSGYDIKHLIRTIVLSRTYQLAAPAQGSPTPLPELFAYGLDKPLSAEVLCRSLLVATGHDAAGASASADADGLRRGLIGAFPTLFDVEYNATLQQATFLTNSPFVENLLKPDGQDLTSRALKCSTHEEQARQVFENVLGRSPDGDELARAVAYLDARGDRPDAAVRQLTWAVLASSEFLLNH